MNRHNIYMQISDNDTNSRGGEWVVRGAMMPCSCIIEFKPALQLNNKIGKVSPSILGGDEGGTDRSQLAN